MRRRPLSFVKPLAVVALGILIHASLVHAQSPGSIGEQQHAVEAGLLPAVLIAGEPEPNYTIYERMRHHSVPGVSIAVVNDGSVEWAEGYGIKQAGSVDSVVVSTLFQAASISKPVAAAGVLRLVEEGQLSLDGNVNDRLQSWRLPGNEYTAERPITLRNLLTHTAGLTVHGFPGYTSGETVPTAVGVLEGAGNTDPVRADTIPGAHWRYSGGGYTVAQVLTQDVTDEAFAAVMEREVLDPLGMYRSTYVQPLPDRLEDAAAVAHHDDGTPVEGRWHTYPEQAAAGLWTTPTDLARFALGVRDAYRGAPGAFLEQGTGRDMLTVHMGNWGLGPQVVGTGDSLRFSHGGSNAGYRTYFVLYPATGDGAAVMTNSDAGRALMMEVVRAIADVYGWPHYQPETRTVVEVNPATLNDYVGEYQLSPSVAITVSREGKQLSIEGRDGSKIALLAESKTEFFPRNDQFQVTFVRDAKEGRVSHLLLHRGGRNMKVQRRTP